MRVVRSVVPRSEAIEAAGGVEWEMEDQTIERRVRVRSKAHPLYTTRLTKRMERVDPALMAAARGEADPDDGRRIPDRRDLSIVPEGSERGAPANDDPYGGLLPVLGDDEVDDEAVTLVRDSWLVPDDD